jgi:arylformamidase
MPRIYDVSRTISPTLRVWPGEDPFAFEQLLFLERGDAVNLTKLSLSAHTGTHMDAPWHTEPVDIHPADLPLETYIGPARVVTVERQTGGIVPADLGIESMDGIPRLLIHSWYSDVPDDEWRPDFVYPTVELADWLAAEGVILLGVDMPSVDPYGSADIPCHHRLAQHDIRQVETMMLKGVSDGVYELVALPLKLADVCGGPVRAILREM